MALLVNTAVRGGLFGCQADESRMSTTVCIGNHEEPRKPWDTRAFEEGGIGQPSDGNNQGAD